MPWHIRIKSNRRDYLKYKESARALVINRLAYFNQEYKTTFNRISIRNQRTRWGSCTSKRNLNFNYKIALILPRLADYIIVHELCHLLEMNHSQKFWDQVARTMPDHVVLRRELNGK